MTGTQVNSKLERGLFGKYDIAELKANPNWTALQPPSDPAYAHGVADSVSEQYHRIDAAWDAANKRLTLSLNAAGGGYWIPYLGNGAAHLAGVAQTAKRGLGTYTPLMAGGAITWAATGPFSGCHTAAFSPAGGRVFAHVITPADGYTADTVVNQVANIAAQVGAAVPAATAVKQVVNPAGEGFVFWTLVSGVWYRRVVYAWAGKVTAVEAKTAI